ncbi:hypothetical protein T02_3230 [Trichinella nativa]|uniref:Uncharacterized protein n=1 Tax=Trichinella nativa TaxID=6335 RepID=A0A0V1JRS1_9BILA|nr:hypothetical protein T02_3230 [Trichinella nativa]
MTNTPKIAFGNFLKFEKIFPSPKIAFGNFLKFEKIFPSENWTWELSEI